MEEKKRISPHLVRGPYEMPDREIQNFYTQFLDIIKKPVFRTGQWQMLHCVPAWEGNNTWNSFLAFTWEGADGERAMVTVNYSPHHSQCFVQLPYPGVARKSIRFTDLMSTALYDREGDDLLSRGLFLDLPPWGYHVFEVGEPTAPLLNSACVTPVRMPARKNSFWRGFGRAGTCTVSFYRNVVRA